MLIDSEQKVTVLGLGYIGLPTAALIARTGCKVTGVDVSQHVVDTVNNGKVHIEEVDLDGLVQGVVSRGALIASTEVAPADAFVIAVPTPHDAEHRPDISHVLSAARAIAPRLEAGNLVILESTSPVGTTEKVAALIAEMRPDLKVPGACNGAADIFIAYCPERVLPGRILVELVDNDRCIGGITPRCARRAMTFYRQFVRGACVTTSARAAEMVKLVENSYRDVNIAFANELSMMAEQMGVDVWEVIRLANRHPRVNILQPGPGVGGHCIAVDPWFLVHGAPDHSRLIRTAREVNLAKTAHVIGAAEMLVSQHPSARIACLGLAFKPNIDDFRESPAVEVAAALARRFGSQIQIVEPYARSLPMEFADTGAELIDLDTALATCDILVVLVDHEIFKSIPLEERGDKIVYDTRGLWLDQPGAAGFIGRSDRTMYMPPSHGLRESTGTFRRLETLVLEKPWGRTGIPREFGDFGERRIGEIWFAHPDGDAAPFMIKFLFTSERLSIQVHPDDKDARAVGLPRGKDECWLVMAADPEAILGVGLTKSASREAVHRAALDGSIIDMIDWRPAATNDFVYNPAGTIHAIGGGLTIVEVQQNVDRTYRLYDYGRPRELHLAEGLEVAATEPVADPRDCQIDPAQTRRLASGPYFHILHLAGPVAPAILAGAAGELTFLPLSSGCAVAGEALHLAEAVLLDDPALISVAPGARALLCWAA